MKATKCRNASPSELHVQQEPQSMECSLACVAMLHRMRGDLTASVETARAAIPTWSEKDGLDPIPMGKILSRTFGARESRGLHDIPQDGTAVMLFVSSYADTDEGLFNYGHYLIVFKKRWATEVVNVRRAAALPVGQGVLVVQVFDSLYDGPYWAPWDSVLGCHVKHRWEIAVGSDAGALG
jgi:hypothetical protein